MKNVIIPIALFACSIAGYAQEWKTDLDQALREASASNRNVLLFFTTAQDCERCMQLEKNVLQSAEFKDYAKDNYVLVKQDFKLDEAKDMEKNLLIVEKYNKDGFFPLVVVINKSAKILGQIGAYNNESPQEYLVRLQSIKKS